MESKQIFSVAQRWHTKQFQLSTVFCPRNIKTLLHSGSRSRRPLGANKTVDLARKTYIARKSPLMYITCVCVCLCARACVRACVWVQHVWYHTHPALGIDIWGTWLQRWRGVQLLWCPKTPAQRSPQWLHKARFGRQYKDKDNTAKYPVFRCYQPTLSLPPLGISHSRRVLWPQQTRGCTSHGVSRKSRRTPYRRASHSRLSCKMIEANTEPPKTPDIKFPEFAPENKLNLFKTLRSSRCNYQDAGVASLAQLAFESAGICKLSVSLMMTMS